MKKLFASLLLLLPLTAQAQSITVSTPNGSLVPGQVVTATALVKNDLTPRAPINITASATYTDWTGALQQATPATISLQVIQPLTFSRIMLSLPPTLTYQAGSAQSTVAVVAGYASNVLTLDFSKTLLEGASLPITFAVAVAAK
jgi:hypothetical protein